MQIHASTLIHTNIHTPIWYIIETLSIHLQICFCTKAEGKPLSCITDREPPAYCIVFDSFPLSATCVKSDVV